MKKEKEYQVLYTSYSKDDSHFNLQLKCIWNDLKYFIKSLLPKYKLKTANPIAVKYTNPHSEPKTAYLFGFNSFHLTKNTGNEELNVEYISDIKKDSYERMVSSLFYNNRHLIVNRIKFQSLPNETDKLNSITYSINKHTGNVLIKKSMGHVGKYLDSYQFVQQMIDANLGEVIIDADTYVEIQLPANFELTVTVFEDPKTFTWFELRKAKNKKYRHRVVKI